MSSLDLGVAVASVADRPRLADGPAVAGERQGERDERGHGDQADRPQHDR
ncbi:MAG TPA: hypothetical protein VK387_09870 [Thermoleophilaceae bacterium]|nr:hypothetical protein [Thermoleophilaceae bacterium]